jgi:deoxycytidine triphosphate deaminase
VILILCDFYFFIRPFMMNSSQLSKENYDIKLFKVFDRLKNAKNSKVSHKELKKVKQEKESL